MANDKYDQELFVAVYFDYAPLHVYVHHLVSPGMLGNDTILLLERSQTPDFSGSLTTQDYQLTIIFC